MTKPRPPLSAGDALSRVIAQLPCGIEDAARIARRSKSTVYAWGNPDTDDDIPLRCAIALDHAFQEAGGAGAPFHELYTLRLELAGATRFADHIELGRLAAEIIRENSEAEEAIVLALLPDASTAHHRATLEEIEQAMAKLQRARLLIGARLGKTDAAVPDERRQTGPPPEPP
ncbi:MAG: hypothetical protein WCY29_16020 [Novosphingobium sp.]